MTLRVELLTPACDASLWRAVVESLPRRDVHYLPEYAALYEEAGVTAHAALLQSSCGAVLYPFLLRDIHIGGAPVCLGGVPVRDMTVPYGIGGPVCTAEGVAGRDLYRSFDRALVRWAEEAGIVSEFLCPHMFTGTLEQVRDNASYQREALKPVVVLSLEEEASAVAGRMNRGHRSAVNKARRNGVTVQQVAAPTAEQYALFNTLHRATLDRQGAAKRWYFGDTFFARTRQELGPERCAFFVANVEGIMAAWQVVLRYGDTAYYYFAGSNARFQSLRPSTLLMYEVSLWAQKQGCMRLYLGGGVTAEPDDSVLRFKAGFSKQTVMLCGAYRILHQQRYAQLEQWQKNYERASGIVPANPHYFPAYRRT